MQHQLKYNNRVIPVQLNWSIEWCHKSHVSNCEANHTAHDKIFTHLDILKKEENWRIECHQFKSTTSGKANVLFFDHFEDTIAKLTWIIIIFVTTGIPSPKSHVFRYWDWIKYFRVSLYPNPSFGLARIPTLNSFKSSCKFQ